MQILCCVLHGSRGHSSCTCTGHPEQISREALETQAQGTCEKFSQMIPQGVPNNSQQIQSGSRPWDHQKKSLNNGLQNS